MKHLLLYTISPVQSFIAQARKARDLYGGSMLLSDLMESVITELNAALGAGNVKVIFPHTSIRQKSNRLLVVIDVEETNASVVARILNETVYEKLLAIGKKVLAQENAQWNKDIENQLKDTIQPYWVMQPYVAEDYRNLYESMEKTIEGIKLNRKFEQYSELGRKCAVSGEHNAIFFRVENARKLPAYTSTKLKTKVSGRYDDLYLTDTQIVNQSVHTVGEGISAIQFIKRFYKQEESFPSTARVAALDTIIQLEDDMTLIDGKNLFKEYKEIFNKHHFDEQLLFEENITGGYFEKHGLGSLLSSKYGVVKSFLFTNKLTPYLNKKLEKEIKSEFEESLVKLKTVYNLTIGKTLKERELKLNSYYALLVFDGDNMGKWLRASDVIDLDATFDLSAYHNRLSKLLGDFANEATSYINSQNKSRGRAIYAGGDDFMAMLNLKNLTKHLLWLRQKFDQIINQSIKAEFPVNSWENLSFSAGIVVAPYKMPLHEVLNKAKSAQETAKLTKSKDNFCIEILKGSGDSVKAIGRWNIQNNNLVNSLETLLNGVQEKFSTAFLKVLFDEFQIYIGYDGFDEKRLVEMIELEAKRTIQRACMIEFSSHKNEEIENEEEQFRIYKKKEIEQMTIALRNLFNEAVASVKEDKMQNFISFLTIIDFFKRKINS